MPAFKREAVGQVILSGASTTISGTPFQCDAYRHVVLMVAGTSGAANLVGKIQGSPSIAQENNMNLTASWSGTAGVIATPWQYVESYELYDSVVGRTPGTTGITITSTPSRIFLVNTDYLGWVNFQITTATAGALTVKAWGVENR